MRNTKWNRDEVTLALALYLQTPYSRISQSNPQIQALATVIGRTAGAVALKLGNLASLDKRVTSSGRKGFSHGARMDLEVWNDYVDPQGNMALERLTQNVSTICTARDISVSVAIPDIITNPDITEKTTTVLVRTKQSFFRGVVLNRYEGQCAITGLKLTDLIEAAHIVPWSEDSSIRLEPSNGLALNPLMHLAYDKHYIGIDGVGHIHVSDRFLERAGTDTMRNFLTSLDKRKIITPGIGKPSADLLDRHFQHYLQAN